jgi:hypothetical protein
MILARDAATKCNGMLPLSAITNGCAKSHGTPEACGAARLRLG